MATYIIKQHNDAHVDGTYTKRFIIYKKRWYGESWKAQTGDWEEVELWTKSLVYAGNYVLKHWTVTEELNLKEKQ